MTTDTASDLRRAAIAAAVSMTQDPAATFKSLANLISEGEQVTFAARGLRAIPRNAWPKDVAGGVAKDLVAWAKQIPAGERTNQDSRRSSSRPTSPASSRRRKRRTSARTSRSSASRSSC
jgi:hypothetical protein